MKTGMKWLSIVLTLCLIVSSVMVIVAVADETAKAPEATQNGIQVALTTSKEAYEATDEIDVTLAVGNNSGVAVPNVSGVISAPASLKLSEGSLTPTWEQLPAAGMVQSTVKLNQESTNEGGPADTGDKTFLAAAIVMMVASAAGLGAMILTGNLKLNKSFCLILLVGVMVVSTVPAVSAAENDAGQIEVAKDITVGGETVTISATVSYAADADDAVITRADMEEAISEVAWSYYMKDVWIQYDSIDLNTRKDGSNMPMSRWTGGHTRLDNYLNTLEDANSDDTMYSVCSFYPWAVYYETLDYPLFGNSLNSSTWDIWGYAENPQDMCVIRYHTWPEGTYENDRLEEGYVTHDKCVTYEELREFLTNWEENLRPGDIFYAISGHACMYVGNGWIIESQGHKYNLVTGEDYFFNPTSGSSYLLTRLENEQDKRICIIRPLDLLTVDDGDGNPDNDVLNEEYELDIGRLHMQFSNDPNNILKYSGYTIQDSAASRVEFPAMNIDRTVNITGYGTAAKDGTITYTVSITNETNNANYINYKVTGGDTDYAGEDYVGLPIAETIPANTELVSAEGATLIDGTLYWSVDIPVGETVAVSYTVKVTGNVGDEIVCGGGWVSSIPSNTITNTIGGQKLDAETLTDMSEFYAAGPSAWNSNDGYKVSASTEAGTRFAEQIYNVTAGLDLQLPEIQELVDMLFTETLIEEEYGMYLQYGNSKTSRYMYTLNDTTADASNQIYRDMLVEGYYGGVWVYTNTFTGAKRTDELRTDYLEAGDILIYMNLETSVSNGGSSEDRDVTEWRVLVYLGNDQFASLNSTGRLQKTEGKLAVLPAFTYDMFVALRPSQAYGNINEDVDAFTGPAADLTDKDAAYVVEYNPSTILLNEKLSDKLAALTPDDGWTQGYFNFAGEVYSKLGIEEPAAAYWDPSYATWMKTIFVDNTDSDSEACLLYQHEYALIDLEACTEGNLPMWMSLLYYGGPTMTGANEITSMDDLHPGDIILAGIRLDRHYIFMIYQGDGKFLFSLNSLSGGQMGYHGLGEWYGTVTFDSDEEFLNMLSGDGAVYADTVDKEQAAKAETDPDGYKMIKNTVAFEAYLVVRPSRVYEDINQVQRDISEGVLTDSEKEGIAALTPADWTAGGSKINLNNVAPWAYNNVKVSVSSYLNKSIYSTRGVLFDDSTGKHVVRLASDSKFDLNTRIMLVDNYYGGTWFPENGSKVFTAEDFEIGDIFAGAKQVDGSTCYWTAIYQGNGQFLVVENNNNGSIKAFHDSTSIYSTTIGSEWEYYYVLRPQNLAMLRDISLAPLTDVEKNKLQNINIETCNSSNVGTDYNNINGFAPWVYAQMGVDISDYIKVTSWNVYSAIFNYSDLRDPSSSKYDANLSAMNLQNAWGGFRFDVDKRHALTADTFKVGDIFSGKYSDDNGKGHYWTAVYLGDSKFLTQDSNTKQVSIVTLDQITALIPADTVAAYTGAIGEAQYNMWEYYLVLRPSQLAVPAAEDDGSDTTEVRDITASVLTDEEKAALAALTADDWTASSNSPKHNLNGAGIWFYESVGIDVADYFDKTMAGYQGVVFPKTGVSGYPASTYYILTDATEANLKYYVMLVENSWGGTYMKPDDQHELTADMLQVGDALCGYYKGTDKIYWVALYQGDGQFLVQQSHNSDGISCFVKTLDEVKEVAWLYYYVLRPENLATALEAPTTARSITTGALTAAEMWRIANLTKEDWPGNKANLTGAGQWFYSAVGIDVSSVIDKSVYGTFDSLFPATTGRESESKLIAVDTISKYAAMLVDGYWGSREGEYKHGQFSASDFQIGDLFVAKGICSNTTVHTETKAVYMVAVYQGNGQFLSVLNCGYGKDCLLSCDYDTTTVFAEDFFAQTNVATWDYYYVLRPSQLADAT